tara:strand:+ start:257 stop:838 length:582 start_codon:yes stop_codon:yes gene_type:complete
MAHRPVVGTGISIPTALASFASTSFVIESQYVRLTPVTEGAHVSISQTSISPTATADDYYIPAGESSTLSMQRFSCPVAGVTTSDTATIIDCPEGMQVPFSVGNYVSFKAGISTMPEFDFKHARVIDVNTTNGVQGFHQTRLTCDANTGGIMTSYAGQANTGGTLYSSARIAARSDGGAGGLHIIQVQTTGEA